VAEKLAEQFPRAKLHPAVLDWAEASGRRTTWAIAFSGGADSLALLLLVWAHWPERRSRLLGLHFNHRLRGRAAAADERYCERVCAALGIKFVAGRWSGVRKKSSEAEARAARFAFFLKTLSSRSTSALWLGHQQDDIAETMLMRLARGSGSGGLGAPRPVQQLGGGRVHLRPLLTVKKTEIVRALRCVEARLARGRLERR